MEVPKRCLAELDIADTYLYPIVLASLSCIAWEPIWLQYLRLIWRIWPKYRIQDPTLEIFWGTYQGDTSTIGKHPVDICETPELNHCLTRESLRAAIDLSDLTLEAHDYCVLVVRLPEKSGYNRWKQHTVLQARCTYHRLKLSDSGLRWRLTNVVIKYKGLDQTNIPCRDR